MTFSGCPRYSRGQRSVHVYVCEAVKQHLKLIHNRQDELPWKSLCRPVRKETN